MVLIAIVDVSTTHVLNTMSENEAVCHTHRKWLEVLIDFILNITENKNATENEYINSFNYNKFHTIDTLRFLYKSYQNSTIIEYFLAACLPNCLNIRISKFLLQYIERIQTESVQAPSSIDGSNSCLKINAVGVFVQNMILSASSSKVKIEFDYAENERINVLIKTLLDKYVKCLNEKRSEENLLALGQYLTSLTECLFSLYDEESIYYDELNLLESLLDNLTSNLTAKSFMFIEQSIDEKSSFHRTVTSALVYLTCLAYKSNLISNEKLNPIYEFLKQVKVKLVNRFKLLKKLLVKLILNFSRLILLSY
jgi:hypothetical protein